MKATKLLVTLAAAGLLFAGCGIKDKDAIIKINDHAITQHQFDKLMDKAIAQSPFGKLGMNIKADKNSMIYLTIEQRVINQLIIQELLDQEADARGIKANGKDESKAIKNIIEKVGGRDNLMSILKQNNVSVSEFKKDIKNQVRMEKLAFTAGKINVTDKDVKAFYDKNIDKFKHGEQVRASHILIEANEHAIAQEIKEKTDAISERDLKAKTKTTMDERKAKAEKIAKELQADNSKFPAYAKKYSTDTNSAKKGGDLGFFEKDKMVEEFSKAAFSAKPNTVTDPVKSQFGYHIIMVVDRKEAGVEPFEKVKKEIKEYLTSEKEIKALDEITQAAKKKAKIEIINKEYDPDVINEKVMKSIGSLKENVQKSQPKAQPKAQPKK